MTGFFEEREGVRSMNRLLSFEMVQVGSIIAIGCMLGIVFGAIKTGEAITLISLAFSFITSGVTSKYIGKRAEGAQNK